MGAGSGFRCPLPLRHRQRDARTGPMNDSWTKQERLLLAVICGVVFLDTLDLSLVQVALPSIGAALDLPAGQLQWIVSAFVLGYGGLLLVGRRLARLPGVTAAFCCSAAAAPTCSGAGVCSSPG